MSPILSVIRNKNFRNLWFGQITSQIAVNMIGFILLIRVYQQTLSNTAVSGMLLTISLPAVIFGVLAGGVVDQFDKRVVLIFCNLLRAVVVLLFFFFSSSLVMDFILAFVFSFITQFFIPAEAPSIPSLVTSDQILPANSLFTFSLYTSTILGFILSGPLLRVFGSQYIYLFITGIMIMATYFVILIPKEKRMNRTINLSLQKISMDIREGLKFIGSNRRVRQSLLLMTFAQALIAVLATLAPGFADRTLKIVLEDSSYLVMGPAAVGLIVGALSVGAWGRKFLKRYIILSGILGSGVTLLLLSLLVRVGHRQNPHTFFVGTFPVGGLEFAIIMLFVLGFTNALISVPASTILQEDTQGKMRGRVYGVFTALTGGVAIVPVILSGVLADTVGVGKTIFVIGIIVLLFGLYRMSKLFTVAHK